MDQRAYNCKEIMLQRNRACYASRPDRGRERPKLSGRDDHPVSRAIIQWRTGCGIMLVSLRPQTSRLGKAISNPPQVMPRNMRLAASSGLINAGIMEAVCCS
jgi:hypothetical protein